MRILVYQMCEDSASPEGKADLQTKPIAPLHPIRSISPLPIVRSRPPMPARAQASPAAHLDSGVDHKSRDIARKILGGPSSGTGKQKIKRCVSIARPANCPADIPFDLAMKTQEHRPSGSPVGSIANGVEPEPLSDACILVILPERQLQRPRVIR